jgi:uncharacterized protein
VATILLILFAGALFAGFIGSLTDLSGGVIIVPHLTIGIGIDIRYVLSTSLIPLIAISSDAAWYYLKEGLLNISAGMFLEITTS